MFKNRYTHFSIYISTNKYIKLGGVSVSAFFNYRE